MTTQRPPDHSRAWRNIAWYGGTTLLAIVVSVVMINAVQDGTPCRAPGPFMVSTTQPNPLDLLTKPRSTPGAPKTTASTDGTCP